jgi:hypothetical protein
LTVVVQFGAVLTKNLLSGKLSLMMERQGPLKASLEDQLDALMCGDFLPDTQHTADPALPLGVVCLVTPALYAEYLAYCQTTIRVPGIPVVHVTDHPLHHAALCWEELGGYLVRRISASEMQQLL